MRIRAATAGDIPGIAFVHSEGWRTTYTGVLPQSHIEKRSVENRKRLWGDVFAEGLEDVFVACDGGKIVGFIAGGPPDERIAGFDAELTVFYLLREVQRQGVGTKLLRALAARMLERGFHAMSVLVLAENPSRAFYERTGAEFLFERSTMRDGYEYHDVFYGWRNIAAIVDAGITSPQ